MVVDNVVEDSKISAFKKAQLCHRRRGDDQHRAEDLTSVVDFSNFSSTTGSATAATDDSDNHNYNNLIVPITIPPALLSECISSSVYHGALYGLKEFPGFVYAPQALAESLQREIAHQSVHDYCEAPHTTNIEQCPPKANEEINQETMWNLWKERHNTPKNCASSSYPDKKYYKSFKKLSWATMGFHYDWTERSYNKSKQSPMPPLMADLSHLFAKTALLVTEAKSNVSFAPTASIVNYYSIKSNMGGHRDDLEYAMDKPIVSISTGLPAIFLLGGKTKEDAPVVPILIRPGDVLMMGGESRLKYHGMARLLPTSVSLPGVDTNRCCQKRDQISLASLNCQATELSRDDEQALTAFLTHHRININVRQVYQDDVTTYGQSTSSDEEWESVLC